MGTRVWLGSLALVAGLLLSSGAWAQGKQDFTLVNQTGYDISHVYVSPSNANEWGEDILGADVLEDKAEVEIEFERGDKTCNWDLSVTYADDDSKATWKKIDLCTVSVVTIRYNRATDKSSATFR